MSARPKPEPQAIDIQVKSQLLSIMEMLRIQDEMKKQMTASLQMVHKNI